MKRILLIEDDIYQITYLRIIFRDYLPTIQLIAVETWEDALVKLSSEHFDLIILDMNLPDAEGLDVIAQINSANKIPILVLTGSIDENLERQARILDVSDFVTKDVSTHSFISLIKSTLIDYK